MRLDDDQTDPWMPEPQVSRPVSANGAHPPGGPRSAPISAGWPGSRWRLDRATVVVLVLVLFAAVAIAGFLLTRRPAGGVAVPDPAPAVSGLPTTAPTGSGAVGTGSAAAGSVLVGSASAGASGAASVAPAGSSLAGRLRVHVIGQVKRPGVVNLPGGSRVEDAVDAAGGATGKADLTAVNLARAVSDGEQIYLPKPGEKPRQAVDSAPAAAPGSAATAGPAGAPLDLNAATLAQLDELPGVGPVLAQRILEYRQQRGRFGQVDELGDVQGIGDATLAKLRPLVRV